MSKLKIALLQMAASGNNQDANLAKGEEFCRRASEMGADIALFPEMWNIGCTGYDSKQKEARKIWQAQAIARNDSFILRFQKLARDLKMAVALTYLEAWKGPPRNSVSLIDRRGSIVMTYAKVHTCDFIAAMDCACTPGDDFYVCDLDTGKGKVKIGTMICYDREFPESARILMLKGAEIILTPNACELEDLRIGQFRIRAFENAVGLAMTNPAPDPKRMQYGRSVAFDADGSLIVEAGKEEGIYLAEFDLEKIREYRTKTIWGNAFRRPHRYKQLTSFKVEEPFIRNNAFGRPFDRAKR